MPEQLLDLLMPQFTHLERSIVAVAFSVLRRLHEMSVGPQRLEALVSMQPQWVCICLRVTRQLTPQRLRSWLSDAVEKSLRCCFLSPVSPLSHSLFPFQKSSPEFISNQKKSVGASTTGLWDFIDTSFKEETGFTI